MILYIRSSDRWINFLHNIHEFRMFEEMYIPGTPILIGDISQFSKPMTNGLLKLLEDNPSIDCFSSKDLQNPVLLSRFVKVLKDPLVYSVSTSVEDFINSNRDFVSIKTSLPTISPDVQLRLYHCSNFVINMVSSL